MFAGSISAHESSYRLVEPNVADRSSLLAETGHGYLKHLPLVAGMLAAILLAGLMVRVGSARGPHGVSVRAWPLLLLPPLGFTLQEQLERFLHSGVLPLTAVLEPTFLVGLALQLPFALAAWACARALLTVAERLRRAFAPGGARIPRRKIAFRAATLRVRAPRISVLALGYGERGPPLLVG
jgi:hypothetical protein